MGEVPPAVAPAGGLEPGTVGVTVASGGGIEAVTEGMGPAGML